MNLGESRGTYVQCLQCGHIHVEEDGIDGPKTSTEALYVMAQCPKCGKYGKGINCGRDVDDVVLYADPYADERYFDYSR